MLSFSINKNINSVLTKGTLADVRPTTERGREWWSEVWFKTLDDRTEDHVNIDAFGYTCERNTLLNKARKETALLTVEEVNNGLRGVADSVASYLDQNVDYIVEKSSVSTSVEQFCEMQEYLLIEEGVNLWRVMELAREENYESINRLRGLITEYSLGDLISETLKSIEAMSYLEEALA